MSRVSSDATSSIGAVRSSSAGRSSGHGRPTCVALQEEQGATHSLIELEEDSDVTRLRGLAHCDVMHERLERARAELLARGLIVLPATAAGHHLRTYGHELRFGCCKS